MRSNTWDEYYEKFYDWAESTRSRNLYALTTLGCADEVAEIIIELQEDISASDRLLQKAVEEKLAFSGSDILEFLYSNDDELAGKALLNSADRLTAEDMESFVGQADDDIIKEVCKKRNLPLPKELRDENPARPPVKPAQADGLGCLGTIHAAFVLSWIIDKCKNRRNR